MGFTLTEQVGEKKTELNEVVSRGAMRRAIKDYWLAVGGKLERVAAEISVMLAAMMVADAVQEEEADQGAEPLISLGPSGLGGQYQNEIYPRDLCAEK